MTVRWDIYLREKDKEGPMKNLTQSYVHGTSDVPLLGKTISQQFDETAARHGVRDALIVCSQDIRWTYAEMKCEVDALAAGLLTLGLEPGDRIGIWSPNNSEWAVSQFASAKAGLVLVNINPAYRLAELEYALNKVECKALIAAEAFKSSLYLDMIRELAPEIEVAVPGALQSEKLPFLKTVIRLGEERSSGMFNYGEIAGRAGVEERARLDELQSRLQFDDAINIQFTSGTTGFPKGATLTHHNILNNGYFNGQALGLSEADRVCIPVPLYHCFGMVMGNMMCAAYGAAMVYPSEGFDPLDVLLAIEAERCTALYGVPTMFIAELDHPEFANLDLSSLRTGTMAGSPCPIEVMKRVINDMNMSEVTIAYGMTETSPVSFQSSAGDSIERLVSTVGRVHPHVEVKIVDEEGHVVAPGIPGELLTRGYSVMLGYWNDDEKTEEAIDAAGWMHTGDQATIDEEGYCKIVGRIKDMVIRGGENVYPREIEEFLYRHPKVQDVQVIGVPDEKYGEELCAWVYLREGEESNAEEIRAFCKGQIAHYKIPRYVKFVDGFPMTVTGKIQKFKMREEMIAELSLAE